MSPGLLTSSKIEDEHFAECNELPFHSIPGLDDGGLRGAARPVGWGGGGGPGISLECVCISDVVIPGWIQFGNQIFIIISEIGGSNCDSDSIKKLNNYIY